MILACSSFFAYASDEAYRTTLGNDTTLDRNETSHTSNITLPERNPIRGSWFEGHLRARVSYPDRKPPDGKTILSMSIGAATAAQVLLITKSGQVQVDYLGELTGHRVETYDWSGTISVEFDNYLPITGTSPGQKPWTFELETISGDTPTVRILAESSVESTEIPPEELAVSFAKEYRREDGYIHFTAVVERQARRPIEPATIQFSLMAADGLVMAQDAIPLSWIDATKADVIWSIQAPETGVYTLRAQVAGSYNEPTVASELTLSEAPFDWKPVIAVTLTILCLAGAWVYRPRF